MRWEDLQSVEVLGAGIAPQVHTLQLVQFLRLRAASHLAAGRRARGTSESRRPSRGYQAMGGPRVGGTQVRAPEGRCCPTASQPPSRPRAENTPGT